MARRLSLMGSSRYEHDPAGLERDVNERTAFYRDTVDPMIKHLTSPTQITPAFFVSILKKRAGNFLLTLDGIEHYVWMNWERLHEQV